MQDSIRSYISTGLIHFMAYPNTMKGEGPIEETIRRIALDDYFDSIEVTWIKDPEGPQELRQAFEREQNARVLRRSAPPSDHGLQPQRPRRGAAPHRRKRR